MAEWRVDSASPQLGLHWSAEGSRASGAPGQDSYARALSALHDGDTGLCAALALATLVNEPGHGPAHLLRAVALPPQELALSAAHYHAACLKSPHNAEAWFNRGVFFEGLEQIAAATDCYRRALAFDPLHIGALLNGTQLVRIQEYFEEALGLARRLKQLQPENPMGHTHEAISLQHLGRLEEADAAFEAAIALSPDPAHLDWEHHFSLLARERFAEAWRKYEARFAHSIGNGVDDLPFSRPRWDGAWDRHVLLYGEQGLGDQIMFGSALEDMRRACARVTLAVAPPLVDLFAASFPDFMVLSVADCVDAASCEELLVRAGADGAVDSVLPIGSLMTRFRNERANYGGGAYLCPSDAARAFWSDKGIFGVDAGTEKDRRLRVGLCWASNPAPERFFSSRRAMHKTMPLEVMLRLASVPGIGAVSLTNVPLDAFAGGASAKGRVVDVSSDLITLDHTAALIETLDLVITVDTGVAHLAGALGIPVWILLHAAGDARWGLAGSTQSYWYDSARLYWQATPGDWPAVVERVARDLAAFTENAPVEHSR